MYVHMYDGGTESVSGSPRGPFKENYETAGEDLGSDLSKQEEDLS